MRRSSVQFNFRTASATKDVLDARIAALQEDLNGFLADGGIERVNVEADWRMRAAQLLRQNIIDTFSMTDPTPILVERRTAGLGDTIEFERLVNTLRVVEYAVQSYPLIFTPRKAKSTISTRRYELAFGIQLEKIMLGTHTLAEFNAMAAEAMTRHSVKGVLTAIDTACAVGAVDMRGRALRTVAGAADVAKLELDAALRRMHAYNSGVTIFGSRYALDPIFDYGASLGGDPTKEELVRRGVIGFYRGARIVEIKDDFNPYYAAWTTVNGADWEKLLFIGSGQQGAIKMERDISALDWNRVDSMVAQWEMGTRMDEGYLVHAPHRYHVVQLL